MSKMETVTPLDRVLARLAELGMSERQLYQKAEIPSGTLSHAKKQQGAARNLALGLGTLQAIAPAIDLTVGQLLGEDAPAAAAAPAPATVVTLQGDGQPLVCLRQLKPSLLNPRKTIEPELIEELAASIREQGLLQNLVVRPTGQTGNLDGRTVPYFELISGERRFRALELLAKDGTWPELVQNIPVKVIAGANDALHLELALIENLQRKDVNPLEEAEALKQLQQLDPKKWTNRYTARMIGCSEAYIRQRINIVDRLPAEGKEALRSGQVSFSQARVLALAPTAEIGERMLHAAIEDGADPERLRDEMTSRMVNASWAVFDLKASGLQTVKLEGGEVFVVDTATFNRHQVDALRKMLPKLKKEWSWVEDVGSFDEDDYEPERSEDRKKAGVAIELGYMFSIDDLEALTDDEIADWDGEVTIHTGLVKVAPPAAQRQAAPRGESAAAREKREAEEKRLRAEEQAVKRFRADLSKAIAAHPAVGLRLFFFDLLVDGEHQIAPVPEAFGSAVGIPSVAFEKPSAMLGKLADLVTKHERGTSRLRATADPIQLYKMLFKVTDDKLLQAFGVVSAQHLVIEYLEEIPPLAFEIAYELGVEVPEILRPQGQQEIEQAPRAAKKGGK